MDAMDVEHPGAPGSKPVIIVAIKHDSGFFGDAGGLQDGLETIARNDVPADGIDQVRVPGQIDGSRNMATCVDACIDADFKHADIRIG